MVETWKDIGGFEGRYQVSNQGRIKALSFLQGYLLRNGLPALRRTKERTLSQQEINSGYLTVHLHLNNKRKALLVHRLVATSFCIGSFEGADVNHKNGIKTDNRAENLEWVTRANNHIHAVALRLNKQAVPVVDPATQERYPSIAQASKKAHKSHRKVAATFIKEDLCTPL